MNIQAPSLNAMVTRMRLLAAQAAELPGPDSPGSSGTEGADFTRMLARSIDQVNATQRQAASLTNAFEHGDPGVGLGKVMVAAQRAEISFQAMTEVRNRLVRAYQDVMNMPI